MNSDADAASYAECAHEFLYQIAVTLRAVLAREPALDEVARQRLIAALTFAVAGHLDGSAFGGRVGDREIYPVLGFFHGDEADDAAFGPSALHDQVTSILDRLNATP